MTRIILVRHGETTWNVEGRYQGQEDTPLSERGLEQGRLLAEAFDEYVEKYPDETILVAAHDAVNKAIICDLMGIGMEHFWQIKQDNTCINVLEYNEGTWRIVLLNSTAHMGYLFSGIEQAGL